MEMLAWTSGSLILLAFAGVAFRRANGWVGSLLQAPRVDPSEGTPGWTRDALHNPVHGGGGCSCWWAPIFTLWLTLVCKQEFPLAEPCLGLVMMQSVLSEHILFGSNHPSQAERRLKQGWCAPPRLLQDEAVTYYLVVPLAAAPQISDIGISNFPV